MPINLMCGAASYDCHHHHKNKKINIINSDHNHYADEGIKCSLQKLGEFAICNKQSAKNLPNEWAYSGYCHGNKPQHKPRRAVFKTLLLDAHDAYGGDKNPPT